MLSIWHPALIRFTVLEQQLVQARRSENQGRRWIPGRHSGSLSYTNATPPLSSAMRSARQVSAYARGQPRSKCAAGVPGVLAKPGPQGGGRSALLEALHFFTVKNVRWRALPKEYGMAMATPANLHHVLGHDPDQLFQNHLARWAFPRMKPALGVRPHHHFRISL